MLLEKEEFGLNFFPQPVFRGSHLQCKNAPNAAPECTRILRVTRCFGIGSSLNFEFVVRSFLRAH